MTAPLILFLAAAVLPIFFGRIRSAPFWLAVQGLALMGIGLAQHGAGSAHALLGLFELLLVRVVIAPLLLRQAIHRRAEPNRELMPSNLFAWAIAIALIVLAFEFGAPEMSERHALTLGVVGATVAVALLLLAANGSPSAQLVALLFMENAIALFETLRAEPWPLPVHAALGLVFLLTVGVGSWLIGEPQPAAPADGPSGGRPGDTAGAPREAEA